MKPRLRMQIQQYESANRPRKGAAQLKLPYARLRGIAIGANRPRKGAAQLKLCRPCFSRRAPGVLTAPERGRHN